MQIQADFVTTHIKKITKEGIELVDGTKHELDVIICATGTQLTALVGARPHAVSRL